MSDLELRFVPVAQHSSSEPWVWAVLLQGLLVGPWEATRALVLRLSASMLAFQPRAGAFLEGKAMTSGVSQGTRVVL